MCGSGARIGTIKITMRRARYVTHKVRRAEPGVCCVVARGTAVQTLCASLPATGSTPTTGSSSGVFVVRPRVFRDEFMSLWIYEFMN